MAARAKGRGAAKVHTYFGGVKAAPGRSAPVVSKPHAAPKKAPAAPAPKAAPAAAAPLAGSGAKAAHGNKAAAAAAPGEKENVRRAAGGGKAEAALATQKSANAALATENAELKTAVEAVEKERDFYFDKLRSIEIMLQEKEQEGETSPLADAVLKTLYATTEDFVTLDEHGEPIDSAVPAKSPSQKRAPEPLAEAVAAVDETY